MTKIKPLMGLLLSMGSWMLITILILALQMLLVGWGWNQLALWGSLEPAPLFNAQNLAVGSGVGLIGMLFGCFVVEELFEERAVSLGVHPLSKFFQNLKVWTSPTSPLTWPAIIMGLWLTRKFLRN